MTWTQTEEPQIHSHLSDELPINHPRAFDSIHCDGCGCLVHAGNNECMQTWIEFENANVCASCAGVLNPVLYSNTWSAPAPAPVLSKHDCLASGSVPDQVVGRSSGDT